MGFLSLTVNVRQPLSSPVFFAEFNGYRSTSGWVKLRSIKPYKDKEGYKIISGNFEFEAKNAEGKKIKITNGTFDGIY